MADRSSRVRPAKSVHGIAVFWRCSASVSAVSDGVSNALNLSMNCCSVHDPMPVSESGVMFAECTR